MKNITKCLLLWLLLCGWTSTASAHKIYLHDGSVIRSDTVWEETLGYFMDEVSFYAYKKAGIPEQTVKRLEPLHNQLVRSEERLLQLIRRQVGTDEFERYRGIIEKYLVKEKVVSYDKFGDTIHLARSKVKDIEYSSPPPSLTPDYIDLKDEETQRAIKAEQALLYKRLRKIRKQKSAYVPDDGSAPSRSGSVDYKQEMRNTQEQLDELERNPLGYFLRYYPELVQFHARPSAAECYALCDGASASVASPDNEQKTQPTIRATSDETLQRYKRCMASCLQEEPQKQAAPEQ